MSREDFIKKSRIAHGDKYDYSLVEYENNSTKVKIICKEHGIFEQDPKNHYLQKQGCSKCSGLHKLTKSEFIKKCIDIHGDRYDYSLVEYINNKTKVKIVCKEHGIFEQKPNNHLNGQNCAFCTNNNIKSTTEDFIRKSKQKYGEDKFDYSLTDYRNNSAKVKIICKEHGVFEQHAQNHLGDKMKTPCRKCYSLSKMIETNVVIERLKEIHNSFYDYSKLEYDGMSKKSIITCPIHGDFKQQIQAHMLGSGCKKCSSSNGEKLIQSILKERGLDFNIEHKFEDCKFKIRLKYDFYIPSLNTCIEFNGRQHYQEVPFFGSFDELVKRDQIKIEYCQKNNIRLVIFKYDDDREYIRERIYSL